MKNLTVSRASAGTGKTYTLAANYVALLLSGESYHSILAVTFTNKATMEMKDRILLFLDNIARNTGKDADAALQAVRRRMIRHQNSQDEELRSRAAECYRKMLGDYDNIHISTIDTFLLQLLNGLGQMLADATAGASVELDIERIITQAVDNLLTKHTANEVSESLKKYVQKRLMDGNSWDIRANLIKVGIDMFGESVQQLEARGQVKFDNAIIEQYRQHLDYRKSACYQQLQTEIAKWSGVTGPANLVKFVNELQSYLDNTCKDEYMFRGASLKSYEKLLADYPELKRIDDLCKECKVLYVTQKLTAKNLADMSLMSALRDEIRKIMLEQNSILLAQTANTLHRALESGDADFILEKSGIRYRHIMLDEFQDTSVLQWENFKPLIEEILSNGGTVFIVGDIKQSIYRWRNGDWTIMAGLEDDNKLGTYYQSMPLSRNFRSSREVVQFNLSLFKTLTSAGFESDYNSLYDEGYNGDVEAYYKKGNEGGFVQLSLVPYGTSMYEKREDAQSRILDEMFSTIESRLAAGVPGSDMFILVRTHDEADRIVQDFQKRCELSPILSKTQLVSCDSFKYESSPSVLLIVHAIRWLVLNDSVSEHYVLWCYPQFDKTRFLQIKPSTPLCELIEEIIKLLPSQYTTETAYINGFADGVHKYTQQYGSNTAAFLEYWESKMRSEAIAVQTADAIQIMTIHVAKGLEAKYVFIPFCSWATNKDKSNSVQWWKAKAFLDDDNIEKIGYVPIPINKETAISAYKEDYQKEHDQMRLDSLNTLYVALTRAGKALFVYGDLADKSKDELSTVSSLLYKALPNWIEQNDILTQQFGVMPVAVLPETNIASATRGKMEDRFAFTGVQTKVSQLHVGERPILFRMTREAMASLQFANEAETERQEHIDLGNVCHSILEHMATRDDQSSAITEAKISGLIENNDAEQNITQLINNAWTNANMCDWFSGKWEILRETTFFMDNEELRPDRIMIDRTTSTAIVLDYKFGQHEKKYAWQVRKYMRILRQLEYKHVTGYLWYAQDSELEQIQ